MHEVRLGRLLQEMHPTLREEVVGLARVAGGAGGDDVGPDVEAAARDGDHMVAREGLAGAQLILRAAAVHALVAVAREEEGVGHLPTEAARHMDELAEPDDEGRGTARRSARTARSASASTISALPSMTRRRARLSGTIVRGSYDALRARHPTVTRASGVTRQSNGRVWGPASARSRVRWAGPSRRGRVGRANRGGRASARRPRA